MALYVGCRGLIEALAVQVANASAAHYSDLISIGDEVFVKAVADYREDGPAAFNTYVYAACQYAFWREARLRARHIPIEDVSRLPVSTPFPFRRMFWSERLNQVTNETQEVISIFLRVGEELITVLPPRAIRGIVRSALKQAGWSRRSIDASFQEIRELVN